MSSPTIKQLVFVIQKHQATSLHYDFRLQVKNKMPSWAIPKGPTLDPRLKRLSVKVSDHDLDYRKFEGNIPEGSEGAGPVMIWDEGIYIPEIEISKGIRKQITDPSQGNEIMLDGIKKGEIKFFLKGKKIKGSFALIKTKNFPPGSTKDNWLMIKHQDGFVKQNYDAKNEDLSVVSGKSLRQIAES